MRTPRREHLVLVTLLLVGLARSPATGAAPRLKRAVGINTALLAGGYGRFSTLSAGFDACQVPCEDGDVTRYSDNLRAGVGMQALHRTARHVQLGYAFWVMPSWQPTLEGGQRIDLGSRFDIDGVIDFVREVGPVDVLISPEVGLGFGAREATVGLGVHLGIGVGIQGYLEHVVLRASVRYQQDFMLVSDNDGVATLGLIGGRAIIAFGVFKSL